jgi:stearoyl-CoA desaturase (delta-9 desaturase)
MFLFWIIFSTQLTILSVTLYLHRSQAHRSVDFHNSINHIFRFWLWLTTGITTQQWTAIHRKHHAKCETHDDPHSPHTKGIWRVLLKGWILYRQEATNSDTIERYGKGTPNDWIEKNIYAKYPSTGLLFCFILNVALFQWWGILSWAIQMVWIPLWAAGVINGLAHWVGYRNHASPDKSTNLIPWGFWIGGEELHNNHHGNAKSAKFSHQPWEFDLGWQVIRGLSALKLAKVKYQVTPVRWKQSTACTYQTLEALIEHRYSILQQYTKEVLKPIRKYQMQEHPKVLEMRERLEKIWKTTNKSKEDLLHDLQMWCNEAIESGIKFLVDFAKRIQGLYLEKQFAV